VDRAKELAALGHAMRTLRMRRGVSQDALAGLAGLDRTYVGGIERGERNASYLSLSRILGALDMSWEDLAAELTRRPK
jgi:transcriptional regulator with XRE-family HTH domain